MRTIATLGLSIILAATMLGCGGDSEDTSNGQDSGTNTSPDYDYAGAASYGDVVTFSIDRESQTYQVDNETTGESDNGSYTTLSGDLAGVYEVTDGEDHFYAVELDDKIIAANFPSGNPLNNISFGVSAAIDNNDHLDKIQGDYIWIIISDAPVNGSNANKEWGVMTVGPSTWMKTSYATNTGTVDDYPELSPDLFTGPLPLTSGDELGEWSILGENKERLRVTLDDEEFPLTGFAYAESEGSAFLIDLGLGNGFLLGLKVISGYDFATIAGDYKFVDAWFDGSTGAGNYSIDANGTVQWTHRDIQGEQLTGSFDLVSESLTLANVFRTDDADLDGVSHSIYLVIAGDIIMHFTFDNTDGSFVSYGTGAKL